MKAKSGNAIRKGYSRFEEWRAYANSSKQAHGVRKQIIESKGYAIADSKLIRRIKEYARSAFGKSSYWPWLAVYTELRGEFVEGWIPDVFYTEQLIPRWNPRDVARISSKKSFDHRIFGAFSIPPLALVVNGTFYDSEQRMLSKSCLKKILAGYDGEVVIKKDSAGSGDGIDFLQGREIDSFNFDRKFSYVIQPSVKQHPAMAAMHEQSVNTLRITTFFTSKSEIHVIHRCLRFGTSENRVVNMSGLFLFLDKKGQAASGAYDDTIGLFQGEKHPDTGYLYRNLKIPSIDRAVKACKEAHQKFPYLRFIAWDLYIDPIGGPHMIEWNAVCPHMWINEALIGPLWGKEEIDEILRDK